MDADLVALTDRPIDLDAVRAHLGSPDCGAVLVFTGTVRDLNEGQAVTGLTYEAYREMAEGQMRQLAQRLRDRHGARKVALVHRIGVLAVGDVAVAVGVATPHRDAAFAACREGIDTLKAEVPIWKLEAYADRPEAAWLER